MSKTISDLEKQAYRFWKGGDYYVSFLMFHSLLEGALRDFLNVPLDENLSFSSLIDRLEIFLSLRPRKQPEEAVADLIKSFKNFNSFRNKLVHNLWEWGYADLNKRSKRAAQQAFLKYNLNIEYLATFDEGFQQKWCVDENYDKNFESIGNLEEWLKDYEL